MEVRVAPWLLAHPSSARAIVILSTQPAHVLRFDPSRGAGNAIFAQDVANVGPGKTFMLERLAQGYPTGLDALVPGTYYVMGLLDPVGSYAYSGLAEGMYTSAVSRVRVQRGTRLTVLISRPVFHHSAPYGDSIRPVTVPSPELSRFWHSPVALHAVVVLPPGYAQSTGKYPVIYVIHSFGAGAESTAFNNSGFDARRLFEQMKTGALPKAIYVYPDARWKFGHTEFADSANNGPWGSAFVHDLISYMQQTYRIRPGAGFLVGHSSGAWSALWLQVRYPYVFAGAWAVSPDPVDFRSFLGTNIYAPAANLYRYRGHDAIYEHAGAFPILTTRQAARFQAVEDRFGSQLASFEAVFGPRGADGLPAPLFDRRTGRVFPRAASAWKNYDISEQLERNWKRLAPALSGKLHIIVGRDDNFDLNEPVSLLSQRLRALHAVESIRIVPLKNHFNIYTSNIADRIAREVQSQSVRE